MIDFEPTNYVLYSQLVNDIESIESDKQSLENINFYFTDDNGDEINTKNEEKEKTSCVNSIAKSLDNMIYLVQQAVMNEFSSKFDLYKKCIENNLIENIEEFPFSSWTTVTTATNKNKEVNLFSDSKSMVVFFENIEDKCLKINNLYQLCKGIQSYSHASHASNNLYVFMKTIKESLKLEQLPLTLLSKKDYSDWYAICKDLIDNPIKNTSEHEILTDNMMLFLMENIKYNKLELKEWKKTLPDYVFEESNVKNLIEFIAKKNKMYFVKSNKIFDDKLVYFFSKGLCNDQNNLFLEQKLTVVAQTEESKLFLKEFSIVNRFQEMENLLEVSDESNLIKKQKI